MQIYDISIDERGKELTAIGTPDFPIAVYLTELNKNVLGYVNWHWHEAIQLCLVVKGSVVVRIPQKEWRLHEGEGCFIPSNILHMICPETDPNSTYICINAEPSLIGGATNGRISQKYLASNTMLPPRKLHPQKIGDNAILQHIRSIYQYDKERAFGYEIPIVANLMELWNLLLLQNADNTEDSSQNEHRDSRIKEIFFFLQEHYGEKLTLNEIASVIHLCPNECCRFFKKHTGKTIFSYLEEYRIHRQCR